MIYFWKIKREILRIASQLLEPYRQCRDAVLRLDYHLRYKHHVKHFMGASPWTERVAVFLIYQPQGMADSVLLTCAHLSQKGYTCVVVCNGALNQVDLNRILPLVGHVIIRPNFGYDFGGYQEGIGWLKQRGVDLRYLLLLNDSVWFPVLKNVHFLTDMENSGADVVGALSAQRGQSQRHQRKLFYASFMLLFSAKVWHSSQFESYWKNYHQTSSKPRTIRQGERKLSALFIHDENFSHHAMVDQQTYRNLSLQLSSSAWPAFAGELGLMDPTFEQQRQALLQKTAPDAEYAWRDWYSRLCESQNMFTCAQASLVLREGGPYIKKSRDPHNMRVLKQSLESFHNTTEFDPVVMREMQDHVERYFQSYRA